MQEDFEIIIPFNIYSHCAVSAARRYVTLMEAQLSQAHSDDTGAALMRYKAVINPDEEDHEEVRWVDRIYEDDNEPSYAGRRIGVSGNLEPCSLVPICYQFSPNW